VLPGGQRLMRRQRQCCVVLTLVGRSYRNSVERNSVCCRRCPMLSEQGMLGRNLLKDLEDREPRSRYTYNFHHTCIGRLSTYKRRTNSSGNHAVRILISATSAYNSTDTLSLCRPSPFRDIARARFVIRDGKGRLPNGYPKSRESRQFVSILPS
jgi:hypothetical protein